MSLIPDLYRSSLSLLTDLYQLTMAYGYWKTNTADRQAVFHLTFRNHPFHGGFTLAAGLEHAIDFITHFRFDPTDIEYLVTLLGNDHTPLFDRAFLTALSTLKIQL